MKNLTKKKFKVILINLLTENLRTETESLKRHDLIIKAAELNKGQINTRLLKHLPEGWSYNTKYNLYHLVAPTGQSHLIGWVSSTKELTPESLKHSDSCHKVGAEERAEKIKNFLQNKDNSFNLLFETFFSLQKAFSSFKQAYNEIDTNKLGPFFNPVFYDCFKALNIPTSPLYDLFKQ